MSEQISRELLKIINEIAENESTISKIEASIFLRESQQKINEKIAYLYNILKIEAENCSQKQDLYYKDINSIIDNYKQKLNMIYDEFYLKYVSIQNELQDANNNKIIAMVEYQEIINHFEENPSKNVSDSQKDNIKNKNNDCKKISQMCRLELAEIREKFKIIIDEKFTISSMSLQLISEQNIFQKILNKISNLFSGSKKYKEILKWYNKTINNMNTHEIIEQIRNETIEFIADVLEIKGLDEKTLNEIVRIGVKNVKG